MYKGYFSSQKPGGDVYGTNNTSAIAFPTMEPVRELQDGMSVKAHAFLRVVETDTAEAQTTNYQIKATGTAAKRGDVIKVTAGTYSGREFPVINVQSDVIYIADDINIGAVTFSVLRHTSPIVDSAGALSTTATLTPSPILFDRNGTDTEVKEDTGTPGDSRPLPVKILGTTGVAIDAATAANQATLIGHVDGIEALLTTIDGRVDGIEALLTAIDGHVDGIEALLTSLDGKDFATQTTLAALNAKFGPLGQALAAASQPVVLASDQTLPLPSGAATAANQATIIGHVDGLEALLTAIGAQLPATLGQKTMANSLAVVLSSDQTVIPASQSGTWSVRAQDGSGNALTSEAVGSQRALHTKPQGAAYADSIRKDYSSGTVTTGAWVELIASTAAESQGLVLFDSSGQTLELGTGAAAAEARKLIIPPGGLNGFIPLRIPAGTRVSVRAVSASASVGELNITLLG